MTLTFAHIQVYLKTAEQEDILRLRLERMLDSIVLQANPRPCFGIFY
jgi:hypothetical protein